MFSSYSSILVISADTHYSAVPRILCGAAHCTRSAECTVHCAISEQALAVSAGPLRGVLVQAARNTTCAPTHGLCALVTTHSYARAGRTHTGLARAHQEPLTAYVRSTLCYQRAPLRGCFLFDLLFVDALLLSLSARTFLLQATWWDMSRHVGALTVFSATNDLLPHFYTLTGFCEPAHSEDTSPDCRSWEFKYLA